MVKGVKGRREVEKNQEHSIALVHRPQEIVMHFDHGGLSAVVAAIGRLVILVQAMIVHVTGELSGRHPLKDLGDECQIGDRPVVPENLWIECGVLKEWSHQSGLESGGESARNQGFIHNRSNDGYKTT